MNDDGEFELVLGNKQLFSVFFIVVVLLGVCFLMGYVVGKNSAPVLGVAIASKGDAEPLVIPPATEPKQVPADPAPAAVTGTVAQTPKAPKVKEEPIAQAPPPATPQPAKPVPAPVAAATPAKTVLPGFQAEKTTKSASTSAPNNAPKQAPLSSQPIPGRVYLQLSATERDSAEGMADLLRSKKFPAIAAQVPERPALYRVLVGPLSEGEIAKTRADLKANSFPADEAVRRVF